MKKKLFIIVLIPVFPLISLSVFSQKQVSDKAKHGQLKRDVYLEWGDWQPKAKWLLGVQINPKHSQVYGNLAGMFGGNKNATKDYQKGDKRTYVYGTGKFIETYSLSLNNMKLEQSIRFQMKTESEFASKALLRNSPDVALVDPFYLLYFKKRLQPIIDWKDSDIVKYFSSAEMYSHLKLFGYIEKWQDDMNMLKDRLKGNFSTYVENGKRIIFYHEIYNEYKQILKDINYTKNNVYLLNTKKNNLNISEPNFEELYGKDFGTKDMEIVRNVMSKQE